MPENEREKPDISVAASKAVTTPPDVEEAQKELRGFALAPELNTKGIINLDLSESGGVQTAARRIPLAEFLAAIKEFYKDEDIDDDTLLRNFQHGAATMREDGSSERYGSSDSKKNLERFSRVVIRLAADGGFYRWNSKRESDNDYLLATLAKRINPNFDSRKKQTEADINVYRHSALPALKIFNNANAAGVFNRVNLGSDHLDNFRSLVSGQRSGAHFERSVVDDPVSLVAVLQRKLKEGTKASYNWAKDESYASRITELVERCNELAQRWPKQMRQLAFIVPNFGAKGWDSDELIDMTLELLDEQLGFIERNADGIAQAVKLDIEAAANKEQEITRSKNWQELQPIVERMHELSQRVEALKLEQATLTSLEESLQTDLSFARGFHEDTTSSIIGTKKAFIGFKRDAGYIAAVSKVIESSGSAISDARQRYTKLNIDFNKATAEPKIEKNNLPVTSQGTKSDGSEFIEQKDNFKKQRDELEKEFRNLEQSVALSRSAIQQELASMRSLVSSLESLSTIVSGYKSGDAQEYVRSKLERTQEQK